MNLMDVNANVLPTKQVFLVIALNRRRSNKDQDSHLSQVASYIILMSETRIEIRIETYGRNLISDLPSRAQVRD
jgi:predicted NUDIX family phosphoesterase